MIGIGCRNQPVQFRLKNYHLIFFFVVLIIQMNRQVVSKVYYGLFK